MTFALKKNIDQVQGASFKNFQLTVPLKALLNSWECNILVFRVDAVAVVMGEVGEAVEEVEEEVAVGEEKVEVEEDSVGNIHLGLLDHFS